MASNLVRAFAILAGVIGGVLTHYMGTTVGVAYTVTTLIMVIVDETEGD